MERDRLQTLSREAVQHLQQLQQTFGVDKPIRLPQGHIRAQDLTKFNLEVLGAYGGKLEACSSSQLFRVAEPLQAVILCCWELWNPVPATVDWSVAEKLQLACCAAETGALTGLAKAASRLRTVVQQQLQDVSKQYMQHMLHLVYGTVALITQLADRWPQNCLLVKAFEPVLIPWVELAVELPACAAAAKRCCSPLAGGEVRCMLNAANSIADGMCCVAVGSSGLPVQLADAVRSLYNSDSLLQLLVTNFTWVLKAKYMQAEGLSTVPARSCSRRDSSTTGKVKAAALLHVPAYHEQLVDSLCLCETAGVTQDAVKIIADNRRAVFVASKALVRIKDYRRETGIAGIPAGLSPNMTPLPLRFGPSSWSSCDASDASSASGQARSCSLPTVSTSPRNSSTSPVATTPASSASSNSTTGSKQQSEILVLLAMIEWIALVPEFDIIITEGLLQNVYCGVLSLVEVEADNTHTVPVGLAAALQQPALQLLTPAVLHLLHSNTTYFERRYILLYYSQLMTTLVAQGHPEDLTAAMSHDPLTAAVALETVVRAHMKLEGIEADMLSEIGEVQEATPAHKLAERPASLVYFTYRVAVAVHQLCRQRGLQLDSSNSIRTRGWGAGVKVLQHGPLPGVFMSVLTTGLKVATAAAAWANSRSGDLSRLEFKQLCLAQVLNQAVLTAQSACFLGSHSATAQQQQQQQRGAQAGASASSSASQASYSNSSSSSSSPGPSWQWMVLVARSLLLISTSVDQLLRMAGETMVTLRGCAFIECNFMLFAAPLQQVLASSLRALDWMRGQLEAMTNTYRVAAGGRGLGAPAFTAASTATSSSSSGHADVLKHMLVLQQKCCDALNGLLPSLEAMDELVHIPVDSEGAQPDLASDYRGFADIGEAGLTVQQMLHNSAGWQCLTEFASAVCDVMPISSSCNNLDCVNFDKPSEQRLVGLKGTRCSGCAVARYCSEECQKQHWKQHKTTCKRLQVAGVAAPGPAT